MTDQGGSAVQRLQDLLSVTDVTLSQLDIDALLVELLWRVRSILDADTAAVLLRDDPDGALVARAACGLEEEVRQGVRVPVGVGFAGSIAVRRRPVFLNRVDETTVANPILWEKGIRVMLGVPLLSGDQVIGVLHVGRLADRPFSDGDAALLQVAGDRITSGVQARRLAMESAAGRFLERGLLPTRMPDLPGLSFGTRYVPAESRSVGGDWYDAFTLSSGELWVAIGDVAGHGMDAAVVMGRVRSALRSYALLGTSAEQAVTLTDHKVRHFEIGNLVTFLCATSTPPYDHLRICSAGHPPPVLATLERPAELLDLPVGPPLGVAPDLVRRSRTVAFPPGAAAVLYTDGLVERRHRPIDEGFDQLRRTVVPADPDTVCRTVMHEMVGNLPNEDDIAVLAVRRNPTNALAAAG